LYSGANPSSQTVGVGFQPDFVWIKSRTQTYGHYVFDVVRTPTFGLITNSTGGDSTGDALTFTSNGFTTTASAGATNDTTGAPNNFISYSWKAGGAAVTNNNGTITSQVSANPTAGFSIVAWTGNGSSSATVGHGLGAVPALILCKERSTSGEYWHFKHKNTASNTNLFLNVQNGSTSAASVGDGVLGDLNSSTTFGFATAGSPGNVVAVNENGVTNIAYCWSEVPGYSSFGTFNGNGASDGPFIYTGFKPKFFLYKVTSHSSDWWLLDGTRNPTNVGGKYVFPNANSAEGDDAPWIDFVSNGIKFRGRTDPNTNGSDRTYIYMAFAENPFKYASAE
jgi:hypothetical protein